MCSNGFKKHTFFLLDKLHASGYNDYMDTKDYRNIRARKQTQQQLKVIAALTHESMLETLERLVQQEYDRLLQEGGKRHAPHKED